MKKLIAPLIVAAFAFVAISPILAADNAKPAAPAGRATPLRGKVDSIDKQAKTFKINDRTFYVTSETKIMKAGKPATFDDVTAGEEVSGSFREGTDKKLNVLGLRIGPRPAAPAKEDNKK